MKVVVIGGTGLIGSKVVEKLKAHGHDATPAAPQTGTSTLTGEGPDEAVAGASTIEGKVHLAPVHYQPIASDDVAAAVARTAIGAPLNGFREVGGPEKVRMDEFVSAVLREAGDDREIVVDEHATYFDTELADDSLVAGVDAHLGATSYRQWAAGATA